MTDETLFIALLDRPPAERAAFLADACGDAAQRRRLDDLLAGHAQSTGILDQSVVMPESAGRPGPPAEQAGAILAGRYKLIEEIGEGGMGAVWLAEQVQPVRRTVAVKLVKAGMDSKSVLARFEAERQALARMDHPHIAKVLDAGTTDAGRPFFVMEYVKGTPITDYCAAARLGVADRLALFVPVCQAVQHAHQKGVVHRDLKPSNILVCLSDGRPVPKVIDFGLAKATHEPLTEHTLHTAHGQLLGTPLYMSPEQAEFNNPDVDTRTDVYALGVTLYELLTGTTPLERDRLRRAPWDEILRLIREEEPPRPSTRLRRTRNSDCGVRNEGLSRPPCSSIPPSEFRIPNSTELDWIVMKCLEKDRTRRYETANGLARDIERYLADEPVEACPPSRVYRLRKAARKYRVPLAAAAAVTLMLVAGVVTLAVALATVNRERRAKEVALDAKELALQAEGKRRKQARAALDALSSQVIEDWLASQPVLRPEHKQFLEQALRQYEEFAADTGQDEESRAGVAHAYYQVGEIRIRLAEWNDAEAAVERGRALFAALAADFPEKPANRVMAVRALGRLGAIYSATGRVPQAVAALEECCTVYRHLIATFPTETDHQFRLGYTLNRLGDLLTSLDRNSEAEAVYTEAVVLHQQLVAGSPQNRRFLAQYADALQSFGVRHHNAGRRQKAEDALRQAVDVFARLAAEHPTPNIAESLAKSRHWLARTLRAGGNSPEAERNYRQAEEAFRRLVADFPGVPEYRAMLAKNLNELGNLLSTKRDPEGERCYTEAAAVQKKLADDFRDVPTYKNDAAGSLTNLAGVLYRRNDFAGARRLLEEALPYHQAALEAEPDHPDCRTFYRNNRWCMALACLAQHDHAPAAVAVDEFLRRSPDPPHDYYHAATFLAVCARVAARDGRLPEAERRELATGYGDRAMTALRRAVELKANEVAEMRTAAAFVSLHSRDDFKALVAEWQKANPPKPEVLPSPRAER